VRVLMITMGYPKHLGEPTAPFIRSIAESLAARGHSIDIVLPFHPEFTHEGPEGVRFFPYRYSPAARFAPWGFGNSFNRTSGIGIGVAALLPVIAISLRRRIGRLLASGSYDVVHAHWVVPNGSLAAGPARKHGVPLVITLHGSDIAIAERHKPLGYLAERAFRAAGAITASSAQLLRRAVDLGADPSKSSTVYLGVDAESFAPRTATSAMRKRIGASDDDFVAVSVGRLIEVKGFEYLIDAASRLQGVRVAIVGGGDLREDLERQARAQRAPVTFFGDVSHDEVPSVLAAADAVVVPSIIDRAGRVDGLPSTVFEALACGKPLIATDVGGIAELVCDGVNGILIPEKDAKALSVALDRLRRDPAEGRRLAEEARRLAVTSLSWNATAKAFDACYESVRRRSSSC
jgi:glycosyltransferase involved in cell wall biosynthesis